MSRRSIHLFFFRASELWQLEEGKEHTFITQIESANKVVNLLNHQCQSVLKRSMGVVRHHPLLALYRPREKEGKNL